MPAKNTAPVTDAAAMPVAFIRRIEVETGKDYRYEVGDLDNPQLVGRVWENPYHAGFFLHAWEPMSVQCTDGVAIYVSNETPERIGSQYEHGHPLTGPQSAENSLLLQLRNRAGAVINWADKSVSESGKKGSTQTSLRAQLASTSAELDSKTRSLQSAILALSATGMGVSTIGVTLGLAESYVQSVIDAA
jgi:hypothetical protein